MRPLFAALALVFAASSHLPARAYACGDSDEYWAYPTPEYPVPTNTRFWFYRKSGLPPFKDAPPEPPAEAFWLEDEQGVRIETDLTRIRLRANAAPRDLFVLSPRRELAAETAYVVHFPAESSQRDASVRVRTGTGPDHDPPPVPRETGRREAVSARGDGGNCGRYSAVFIDYEVDEPGEFMLTALDGFDSVDTRSWSGQAHGVLDAHWGSDLTLEYGTRIFGAWPEDAGQRASVRMGAFDFAGNFSGWSEPSPVQLPDIPSDGCSVQSDAGASATPLVALLATLLTVALRSRTRRR